jgi:hypothetical protein
MRPILFATSIIACGALRPGSLRLHRPSLSSRRSPLLMQDDDELDAEDTVDSWDAQMAEMEAWTKSQRKADAASILDSDTGVDEEAHYDLGGDPDDDDLPDWRDVMAEKQAMSLLGRYSAPTQAAESAAPARDDKKLLTSLEAVLNAMNRLSDKVDALSAKVDALTTERGTPPSVDAAKGSADEQPQQSADAGAGAAPAPPAARAASEPSADAWDGEVDETAWFDEDDDDDDKPDWRDVRRLNKLL